ncbi:MAG: hypothetical protein DMD92_15910 [Candidatus Rokuibacteriota bacterium]|nr:MAG: hypothetical protein DMD92_15910 [Candidatus Rokubacteria bacterium]
MLGPFIRAGIAVLLVLGAVALGLAAPAAGEDPAGLLLGLEAAYARVERYTALFVRQEVVGGVPRPRGGAAHSGLPVGVIVHDRDDGVVAEYAFRDLKLDAELTAADFDAANPAYGFPRWRWQLK